MGSIFITIAVFIFGFFGFLAIWSGLWQYDYTDEDSYNIVLFTLLNNKGPKVGACCLSTADFKVSSCWNAQIAGDWGLGIRI